MLEIGLAGRRPEHDSLRDGVDVGEGELVEHAEEPRGERGIATVGEQHGDEAVGDRRTAVRGVLGVAQRAEERRERGPKIVSGDENMLGKA